MPMSPRPSSSWSASVRGAQVTNLGPGPEMASVLDDVRVLDLSWGIAGPVTGMLLSDHGADVIKIEPPGDPRHSRLRRVAPRPT